MVYVDGLVLAADGSVLDVLAIATKVRVQPLVVHAPSPAAGVAERRCDRRGAVLPRPDMDWVFVSLDLRHSSSAVMVGSCVRTGACGHTYRQSCFQVSSR